VASDLHNSPRQSKKSNEPAEQVSPFILNSDQKRYQERLSRIDARAESILKNYGSIQTHAQYDSERRKELQRKFEIDAENYIKEADKKFMLKQIQQREQLFKFGVDNQDIAKFNSQRKR